MILRPAEHQMPPFYIVIAVTPSIPMWEKQAEYESAFRCKRQSALSAAVWCQEEFTKTEAVLDTSHPLMNRKLIPEDEGMAEATRKGF